MPFSALDEAGREVSLYRSDLPREAIRSRQYRCKFCGEGLWPKLGFQEEAVGTCYTVAWGTEHEALEEFA